MTVTPYKNRSESKKEQVADMFDSISPRYDFLNHFLSLGIDIYWRKRVVRLMKEANPQQILDVATGTADLAIESLSLSPEKVIGVDISDGMLEMGRKKVKKINAEKIITLENGDSEQMRFSDNEFDIVTSAFGVRNFENLEAGLKEFYRVMKPGGTVLVLEFSQPTIFPFKQIYNFYFKNILPRIGRSVSKDEAAYEYLPESVGQFPSGEKFVSILNNTGFKSVTCTPLTFGISSIYRGVKPLS